jgi:hypothetical protein
MSCLELTPSQKKNKLYKNASYNRSSAHRFSHIMRNTRYDFTRKNTSNCVGGILPLIILGPIGPEGDKGPDGLKGVNGEQGPIGEAGQQGPIGEAGQQGPMGLAGQQGPMGMAGQQGPIGLAGQQGPIGMAGQQGPIGEAGQQGPMGATGQQGPMGATGQQGPIGEAGQQGPMGATGQQGPMGATGQQGPMGLAGQQGPMGATGQQGPMGLAGQMGLAGSIGPTGNTAPNDIYQLGGVVLSSPQTSQVLIYNGTNYTNRQLEYSDISGTIPTYGLNMDYGVVKVYGQLKDFSNNATYNLFKNTSATWHNAPTSLVPYTIEIFSGSGLITHDSTNGTFYLSPTKIFKIQVEVSLWYSGITASTWILSIKKVGGATNEAETKIHQSANNENVSLSLVYYSEYINSNLEVNLNYGHIANASVGDITGSAQITIESIRTQ